VPEFPKTSLAMSASFSKNLIASQAFSQIAGPRANEIAGPRARPF